jgi:predicted anti-sigma-YlaC factor YlaD
VTRARDQRCDTVQLAAMARLDGEPALASGDEYDTHVAGCEECREVIAAMARLHAELDSVSYDTALTDLWR